MFIKVRVTPGAKQEQFTHKKTDHFDIKVKEKAERNMANRRVMELIAHHYNIPIGKVRIINGHHSPSKIFSVDVESVNI